jgi:hypothetical protein
VSGRAGQSHAEIEGVEKTMLGNPAASFEQFLAHHPMAILEKAVIRRLRRFAQIKQ